MLMRSDVFDRVVSQRLVGLITGASAEISPSVSDTQENQAKLA